MRSVGQAQQTDVNAATSRMAFISTPDGYSTPVAVTTEGVQHRVERRTDYAFPRGARSRSEMCSEVPSRCGLVVGAEGGIRTPTAVRQLAPEASASAVPPLPQVVRISAEAEVQVYQRQAWRTKHVSTG